MENDCYVRVDKELMEAKFMGIFQHSEVLNPSPLIYEHEGGVVAYPVAVVKIDKKIRQVHTSGIVFKE